MAEDGLYCSTAGTYFHDQESLHEHYRSAFHRYNLKRKVAGLPPVTREWYEERRAALQSSGGGAAASRQWYEPLSGKKFGSENTYLAFTRSKRYAELVARSGAPAPEPVISIRRAEAAGPEPSSAPPATAAGARKPGVVEKSSIPRLSRGDAGPGAGEEEESEWESASEAGEEEEASARYAAPAGEEEWEEWDVRRSLFDNRVGESLEDNLSYMWKNFGFYLEDPEFLTDPAGLVRYLGAKLAYGRVPLYASGEDPDAKQYPSLHAVQRHMVDTNQCKMLYEDNEDEYQEWYDYGEGDAAAEEGGEGAEGVRHGSASALMALDGVLAAPATASAAYELVLPRAGGGTRILGSREFARYYRQRHARGELRPGVDAAVVLAQYRRLALPALLASTPEKIEAKRAQRIQRRVDKGALKISMRRNVNDKLPKNVPY